MSDKFSISSWALGILRNESCIAAGRDKVWWDPREDYYDPEWPVEPSRSTMYYALAEDQQGEHLPYPKLPAWAKRLFGWRLRLGRQFPLPIFKCRVRGVDFKFRCPVCNKGDFFSLRGKSCWACGSSFDWEMNVTYRGAGAPRYDDDNQPIVLGHFDDGQPVYGRTKPDVGQRPTWLDDIEVDDPFAEVEVGVDDVRERARAVWDAHNADTSPRAVPVDVECCPQCGGELVIEIEEWDAETGAPTEGSRVWCKTDYEYCFDDGERQCNAGGYDFVAVAYRVLEWARENVSVYPCPDCGRTSDRPGRAMCYDCKHEEFEAWDAHPTLNLEGVDG